MNHKKYSNIALDHTKVVESLTDLGVGSVSEYPQNGGKHLNYKGLYKGREFLVKVFINKGGKCTLFAPLYDVCGFYLSGILAGYLGRFLRRKYFETFLCRTMPT